MDLSMEAETDLEKTIYVVVACFLVLIAGLMSGLTLGLMSLDQVDLEVCFCQMFV
jgi:hypothetical protein